MLPLGYGNKHLVIGCVQLNKQFPLEKKYHVIVAQAQQSLLSTRVSDAFFFIGCMYFDNPLCPCPKHQNSRKSEMLGAIAELAYSFIFCIHVTL